MIDTWIIYISMIIMSPNPKLVTNTVLLAEKISRDDEGLSNIHWSLECYSGFLSLLHLVLQGVFQTRPKCLFMAILNSVIFSSCLIFGGIFTQSLAHL